MLRILVLTAVLFLLAIGFACTKEAVGTGGGATPTEAYKQLFAAVKSKDIEAIKRNLTKKTIEFGTSTASLTGLVKQSL